jgi:hypothetical protein
MSYFSMIVAYIATVPPMYLAARFGHANPQWDFRLYHYLVQAIMVGLCVVPFLVYSKMFPPVVNASIGFVGLVFGIIWIYRGFSIVDSLFKMDLKEFSSFDRMDSWMARWGIGIAQSMLILVILMQHLFEGTR